MKLVFWAVVLVALGYVGYSAMISVWSYFSVAGAVDDAFARARLGGRPDAAELKQQILQATNEAGVPLIEQDVSVTETARALQVYVVWSIPVFIVKGEPVLAIPLSVKRTLDVGDVPAAPAGRPRIPLRR